MPNASARALMLGRSGTVGAVVPTLDNAIFAKGLEQLQASMAQADVQLIAATTTLSSRNNKYETSCYAALRQLRYSAHLKRRMR
jgi:DNA-binding LacI/PurR family transcriptional regulator